MKIEKVKIDELISPDYNPRDITPQALESLKKSINEFGYIDPLIVNKHNMHIVGGNQRYEALKQLGVEEVEVSYVDIQDINQEKALNIRLNNSSGKWNDIKLNNILEELKVENIDISLTGFEDIKIQSYDEIDFNDNNIFNNDYDEDLTEYTPSNNESYDFENEDIGFQEIDELYEDEDTNPIKQDEGWNLNYTLRFNNPKDEDLFYNFLDNIKDKYKNDSITENLLEHLNKNMEKHISNMPFKSDFEIIFKTDEDKKQFIRYNETLKNRYPHSKYPLIDFIKEFENGL